MIELLKTHIKNEELDKVISLIKKDSDVLNLKDDNGSSGLMIIAYSGFDKVFEQAVELKKSFTFHEAIVCGKTKIVNDYLDKPDFNLINVHSDDGFTPLSLAVFFNQTEIAKYLIELGADPNLSAKNPSKVNALHSAISKENYELCKLLIENGTNVNAVQMQNVTALHSAVHRGNLDLVKLLIENNASTTSKMDNGDTALIIAKREGHKNIAEYLSSK
ncbi:MAG: ankyrin repeat domain-containing protein [Bacteroidota bacterium]